MNHRMMFVKALLCAFFLGVWCFALCSPALGAPGSWTQKADMPGRNSCPASCVLDGILYVIGGAYPYQTALATVWAYNPATDLWTRKADLPSLRRYAAAAAVDGIVYVVGGAGAGWPPGTLVLPVAAYDPKTNQWSKKTDLPKRLWFPTASLANGLIYLFQGTDTFSYDAKADRWTKRSSFSPWSFCLMSATVGETIFLFGGQDENLGKSFDFALAYDPFQDRFTARRTMPRTRLSSACGAIDGKIYLAAGPNVDPVAHSDAIYYTIVDVFDPQGGVMPQILSANLEETNRLRLVWQAEAGIKYGVESSPEILTNRWPRVTLPTGVTATATNGLVETSCPVVPGEPRRFFRVFETN